MKRIPFSCRKFVEMIYSSLPMQVRVALMLRRCFFVLPLSFLLLFTHTGYAQVFNDTLTCNDTIRINIGDVLVGDSIENTINIFDSIGHSFTWASHGTNRMNLIDTAGQVTAGTQWQSFVICKLDSLGPLSVEVDIQVDSDASCNSIVLLSANGIAPTKDSFTFYLQDTSKEVIAFQTNSKEAALFYFKNNSDTAIEIDSIYVTQSNTFSIISHPSFHFSLPAKDSFALGLVYERISQGSDNGQLQFAIGMPAEPILPVALQGVRTGNDAVQTQPTGSIYFSLYPNPSYGPVTIHTENIAQVHVTITDVLGRALTEASFTGDWVWDGEQSGTYFVNISAITTDGFHLHEVRRVVMMK